MNAAIQNPLVKEAAICPSCGAKLATLDYKIWGTKRYVPATGFYEEDDGLGKTDIEFSCPHCSVKLDPEGLVF